MAVFRVLTTHELVHQQILGHFKEILGPMELCDRIYVNPTGYRFASVNRYTPNSYVQSVCQ